MWELAISDMKICYETIDIKTIWSYHSSRQKDIPRRTKRHIAEVAFVNQQRKEGLINQSIMLQCLFILV